MSAPILLWFRRDLRLSDHQALNAAVETGRPVIPVFIHDDLVASMGAAPKWRLGLGLAHFQEVLEQIGSRLILRKGIALDVLRALLTETGADTVYWSRDYAADAITRDKQIKAELIDQGIEAKSFGGQLLFEPWQPKTKSGTEYKVYSPFWRAVKAIGVSAFALHAPTTILTPENWPRSDDLHSWNLGGAMNRGAVIVEPFACVGEACAQQRLTGFIENLVTTYKSDRDFPAIDATSRLSENLTYGEISPRQIWHAGIRALEEGAHGAEHFLKELVWREFAYHLMYHFPDLAERNWRRAWDGFPWGKANDALIAWQQGMTGEPFVDAAMRELYVTGTMHNRLRMVTASYLTKHLMIDWRLGMQWFADCLIDWDPAANAMGWQWVAGCGPDATPYFRVFNPAGQADKFDKNMAYRRRFLNTETSDEAKRYFSAVPRSWGLDATNYPAEPIVDLAQGRARALAAYKAFRETSA